MNRKEEEEEKLYLHKFFNCYENNNIKMFFEIGMSPTLSLKHTYTKMSQHAESRIMLKFETMRKL